MLPSALGNICVFVQHIICTCILPSHSVNNNNINVPPWVIYVSTYVQFSLGPGIFDFIKKVKDWLIYCSRPDVRTLFYFDIKHLKGYNRCILYATSYINLKNFLKMMLIIFLSSHCYSICGRSFVIFSIYNVNGIQNSHVWLSHPFILWY